MGWATSHIENLKVGKTVFFRPRGNSMAPLILSGQFCTVAPVREEQIEVNDVVLCKVNGREYLHLVKAARNGQFQIGNNRGFINGWVKASSIYGRLIDVRP